MQALRLLAKRQAWLCVALLSSVSMSLFWNRLPRDSAASPASIGFPRARPLTDLFQPWFGARELFLRHRDPYGPEVTREIQIAFYGKGIGASDVSRHPEAQFGLAYRFAYPLYVVLFVAPAIGMQFSTAQTVYWWLLLTATAVSVPLWLNALRIRLPLAGLIALCGIVLTSLPVMQGLHLRQLGLLAAALIAGAAASIVSGHLFLAGVLLALATIKPQLSLLAIAWFALWICAEWRQRRALAWGFCTTLAALVLASELLLPGWVWRFQCALLNYATHAGTTSFVGMLLPSPLQWLVFALGGFATAVFCWHARGLPAESASWAVALALVLDFTTLVMPTVVAPYNHVLLLPGALLVIDRWQELWGRSAATRIASLFFCVLALLPWMLVLILTLATITWQARDSTVPSVPFYAGLGLPLAAFGLLILLSWTPRTAASICPTSGSTEITRMQDSN